VSLEKTITRIAKTYYDVLVDGAQPAQLQALAMMSDIISTERDVRRVADTIALRAGQADDRTLRQVLAIMQRQFEQRMCEDRVSHLRALFHKEGEKGWTAWLETMAAALVDGPTRLIEMLITTEFAYPERVEAEIVRIRRLTRYYIQERFEEAYELITYLANQEVIAPLERAKLHVLAAEVQIYRFTQFDEGKRLLQIAEEMAPDEILVKCGWAIYWLQQSKIPEAKKYLEQALKQADPVQQTYNLMGDCYSQQGDYDAAGEWYREATKQVDSSASWGYARLIQLYGRTEELFHTHEAEFESLLERFIAMDPTNDYTGYLTISAVYQQFHLYKQAHGWCERAIQAEELRLDGHIAQGRIYTEEGLFDRENKRYDEAQEAFSQAEACFQKVIEIDSSIFEGYWNIGELREHQERWQEGHDWFERSLPFRPMWEQNIRIRMGEMLWKMGRYEEAVDEVLRALRLKPDEQWPSNTLEAWAEDFYKQLDRPDDARRLYDTIRQNLGSSYEATYQNRLGNLVYYGGDYQAAIDYYNKAIDADPTDPVYYSNLAYAWERVKSPGHQLSVLEKAVTALRHACEMVPRVSSYAERLANLETQLKLARQFGEFILELVPDGFSIVVELGERLIQPAVMVDGKLPVEIQTIITTMRQHILDRFGIRIPPITFKDNSELDKGGYVLKVPGLPPISGVVQVGKRYCERDQVYLAALDITAEVQEGGTGCWIAQPDWSKAEENGLPLWQEIEFPLHHLENLITWSLPTLADHRQLDAMLAEKKVTTAAKFKENPKLLTTFVVVLKALLAEKVSIASLEQIAAMFLEKINSGEAILSIAEHLRSLPDVMSTLPGNEPSFSYFRFRQELEEQLSSCIFQMGYGPLLAIQSTQFSMMMEGIAQGLDNRLDRALLVSDNRLRPLVRAMMGVIFYSTPALSEMEVSPEWKEKEIVEITLVRESQAGIDDLAVGQVGEQIVKEQSWRDQFMIGGASEGDSKEQKQRGRETRKLFDSQIVRQDAEQIKVYIHPDVYWTIMHEAKQENEKGDGPASGTKSISEWVAVLQSVLYEDIGLIIPLIQFGSDERLRENEMRIEPGEKKFSLTLAAENSKQESEESKQEASVESSEPTESLAMRVTADLLNNIKANAGDFLTLDSVRCNLAVLRQSFPALVDSVLARFDLDTLTLFLKNLLDLSQSIKDLRTILEELVMINGTILIDPEKHVLFPAGYILTGSVQEGSTLLFLPYTARLCSTTEEKTLESLNAQDYARYVSQLITSAS
jgi:tetratricopeptide (TPR) repeat protein